jgi:hypothetical protein
VGVDWTCIKLRTDQKCIRFVGKPESRHCFIGRGVDGKTLLNLIQKEQGMKV